MRDYVLVATFMLSAPAAFARREGARMSGRVTDPTDAVIVGAECTITGLATDVPIPANRGFKV